MYMMYADESGDPGAFPASPSRYFVLTGLVVHELRWHACLEELKTVRKEFKSTSGLKLREEFHAAQFISKPGGLSRIPKFERLAMIRKYADCIAILPDVSIINIVVDKSTKSPSYPVFEMAWTALIQRFHNGLSKRSFRGPINPDERGILLPDNTDGRTLASLVRKKRKINFVPSNQGLSSRNLRMDLIVEDPILKDSRHSWFTQTADVAAFLLYQKLEPNSYMRRKSGQNYFDRLEPALYKLASNTDPLGIVRI